MQVTVGNHGVVHEKIQDKMPVNAFTEFSIIIW